MLAKRYAPGVAAALTEDFKRGGAKPDLSLFLQTLDPQLEIDLELVRDVIAHALDDESFRTNGGDVDIGSLDGWLAPRIHYVLRVSRRTAADPGFWSWLTLEAADRYVRARWSGSNGCVSSWRYTGPDRLRNALARLWWGAEMVRNGPSYEYVPYLFRRVRTAQYALELRYSWYRPAAIAFVRVAEGLDGMPPLERDDDLTALSKKANAYLSLLSLEAIGLVENGNQHDAIWRAARPTLREVLEADPLEGPSDGAVSEESILETEAWLRQLL